MVTILVNERRERKKPHKRIGYSITFLHSSEVYEALTLEGVLDKITDRLYQIYEPEKPLQKRMRPYKSP
jgi:hypothetical protein